MPGAPTLPSDMNHDTHAINTDKPASKAAVGGAKTIGLFSSIALLINNITGPGIPSLPNMFVEAGWLVPLLCLLGIWLMTTLSASMYCEAMECMSGNEGFCSRVEYSTIVGHYFGRRWYIAAQIGLNGALQSLCIISVVQSAQVMDVLISALFTQTCAINLTPFALMLHGNFTVPGSAALLSCVDTTDFSATGGNPWGCHVVLSLGFVLVAAMAIPCGAWNLDDNMIVQRIAFFLTCTCWVIWLVAALTSIGGDEFGGIQSPAVPAINTNPKTGSIAGVLGTILFNFGFVTTVPSWVNEKKPSTRVNSALWSSTTLCVVIYILMGIPAALAFAPSLKGGVTGTCERQQLDHSFDCADDLMQLFTQPEIAPWRSSRGATLLLQGSVYLFPIVAVVSSIPVFSIVIKYNLVENGMSPRLGFLWGVVFPWVVAFPLVYMPDVLAQIINLSSLVFVSFTDFVVPFSLYVILQRRKARAIASGDGLASAAPPLLQSHRVSAPAAAAMASGPLVLSLIAGGSTSTSTVPEIADTESGVASTASATLEAVEAHHVFPTSWACCTGSASAQRLKIALSAVLGSTLALLSAIAIYLTIVQGSYSFDAVSCAHA